jgi:hypothetical protein
MANTPPGKATTSAGFPRTVRSWLRRRNLI